MATILPGWKWIENVLQLASAMRMPQFTKRDRASIETEDRADVPTTRDLIEAARIVAPIVERISTATLANTPLTVGLYGDWGSGKTSILKMLDAELKKRHIHPVWFNAWKYGQEESLWSALIQTILDRASISGSWYRRLVVRVRLVRQTLRLRAGVAEVVLRVGGLAFRVALILLSALIVSGWVSERADDLVSGIASGLFFFSEDLQREIQTTAARVAVLALAFLAVRPDTLGKLFDLRLGLDYSKFRRTRTYKDHISFIDSFSAEFRQIVALIGCGKPLVVIIDDLDRCLPERSIEVLEAIKLFLDVPGCIFILAVDRDIVERAIAVKYKDFSAVIRQTGDNGDTALRILAENYFEKIIQLPITLPPMSEPQVRSLIKGLYANEEHVTLCMDVFAAGLPRNPRKIKRIIQSFLFLNALAARNVTDGSVRTPQLAKLVMIQSQYRDLYVEVTENPSLLVELERYHRWSESGQGDPRPIVSDPILEERVSAAVARFPLVRRILIQSAREDDTFEKTNIEPYIYLLKPLSEKPTPSEAPASPDPLDALRPYLLNVLASTQALDLRGISPNQATRSRLEDLFVLPRLVSYTGSSPDDQTDGREFTVRDVLRSSARVVILGKPGAGKSALLRYMARISARGMTGEPALGQGYLPEIEHLLPILVPLREYGEFLQARSQVTATPSDLLDFLGEYLQQRRITIPGELLASMFERGNCLLLLDGLDELPSLAVRQQAVNSIMSLAERFRTIRIIVTSRLFSYRDGTLSSDFGHYVLAEFRDDDIRRLLEQWFAASMPSDPDRGAREAQILQEAIDDHKSLRSLARTPLLLTVIAIVWQHEGGRVAASRFNLYEQAADVLLAQWDSRKPTDSRVASPRAIRQLLADLALRGYLDARSGVYDTRYMIETFSQSLTVGPTLEPEVEAASRALVTELAEHGSVLVERRPNWFVFVPREFEAYFAAAALSLRSDIEEIIRSHSADDRWSEVISLALESLADRFPTRAEQLVERFSQSTDIGTLRIAVGALMSLRPEASRWGLIESVGAQLGAAASSDPSVAGEARRLLEQLDSWKKGRAEAKEETPHRSDS